MTMYDLYIIEYLYTTLEFFTHILPNHLCLSTYQSLHSYFQFCLQPIPTPKAPFLNQAPAKPLSRCINQSTLIDQLPLPSSHKSPPR